MPPCPTSSEFGEFCEGGGPLTDSEAVVLQNWVNGGCLEGEKTEPKAGLDPKVWINGTPDIIVKPNKVEPIPEEGRPYWMAYVIPTKSFKDRRIQAFDFKVKQPLAIRSIVVAMARPGLLQTKRAREGWTTGGSLDDDAQTYLGVWASGYPIWKLPNGVSFPVTSDALVVQVLYWPRGKAESGDFELGLYWSKTKHEKTPEWKTLGQEEFSVPAPGSLVLNPSGELPNHSDILAVFPEARFFCTSIRLWANDKLIFMTRRWEPYWQGPNRFETPIRFDDKALLRTEFNYDNDIHMGRNEGRRPRPIMGGTRERDEMCRIHVLYVRSKT